MLSLLIPSNHPNEHFNHTPGFYASLFLLHASLKSDSSDSTEDLSALLGVPARAGSYRVKSPLVEKDTFVCTMTFLFCSVHQFSLVFTLIYEIYSYIKDDQNDVNRNFHKL